MSRKRPRENTDDSSDEEDDECRREAEVPEEKELPGIIENVTLVNFLCHGYLSVPFGPRVNFVIGKNGSGKSAIMTGIVVALGGRAAQTSRGLSVKNFVKKGCSSGHVSVTLRNRGSDAFKHNKYGDSVTIERRISSDGGSSYRVKSKTGTVISTQRNEIDQIVDHFNIQVDNPVSLLNQDTSRHLLNSNDERDLYKFFMKATSLEQLSNDYYLIMENKNIALDTLQRKEQVIPDLREHVRTLEAKSIALKQLRDIKEQLQELKGERVWAEVAKSEKEATKKAASAEKLSSGLPKFDKEIQECEVQISAIENQVKTVETDLNRFISDAQSLENEQQKLMAKLQEKKAKAKENQSTVRRLQHELEEATDDKNVLQEKIEEMRTSAEMRNLEEECLKKDLMVQKKKRELAECDNELRELINSSKNLQEDIQREKEHVSKVSGEEQDLKKEISRLERQVHQAKFRANNRLLLFGDWMPTLLDKIGVAVSQGRFTKPPRGPIGIHVQLKEEKWSRAIESSLGKFGSGFCVSNFKDFNILNAIIKANCRNFFPAVIMCPFEETLYDVSSHKPRCEFPTVLDMVQIDDPVLANCLIDQLHIERTLLIENSSNARRIIWSKNAPAHQAFAANGDHIIGGKCAKLIVPVRDWRNYLSSQTSDNTSAIKKNIEAKKNDYSKVAAQKKLLENTLKQKINEQQEASKRKKILHTSMNNLKLEIDELLESLEEVVAPDIVVLVCEESELEQCTQRVDELSEQSQAAQQGLDEATALVEEQKRTSDTHKKSISKALGKAEPLKDELESLMLRNDQEKTKKHHFEKERRKFEQKIKEAENERDRLIKLAEQKAEITSRHYDRVETSRTVQDLETEILKKEKYVQQEEKNHGNAEEVMKEYKETRDKFAEIVRNRKSIEKYNKKLNASMEVRMNYLKEKRKYLASNTSQFFTQHLSQRGFSGYISFNHKEETVRLIVNVHKGPQHVYSEREVDESTSIMKSLSGGERSVSTISFLTALWGTMESPFRCLDEFDVFMDLWNRKVIMKMVLEIAMLPWEKHRQFIFLTPQDLSCMPIDKNNVRIFQLADPDR